MIIRIRPTCHIIDAVWREGDDIVYGGSELMPDGKWRRWENSRYTFSRPPTRWGSFKAWIKSII